MLDPLAGAVGYGMAGPWWEEPHRPFGAAERRWPRRWPCRAGRPAAKQAASGLFAVGRPVQSDRVTLRA
jgi:hypothetical protein